MLWKEGGDEKRSPELKKRHRREARVRQGAREPGRAGSAFGLTDSEGSPVYGWGDHSLLRIIDPALTCNQLLLFFKFNQIFIYLFIYWSVVDHVTLVSGVRKLIFNFSFWNTFRLQRHNTGPLWKSDLFTVDFRKSGLEFFKMWAHIINRAYF